MDDQAFWELLEETRGDDGSLSRRAERLGERLGQLDAKEVANFARLWRKRLDEAYRWDVWAAAYVIEGGCSDDAFDYFRSYLISLGQDVFRATLLDPDSLADVIEPGTLADWEEADYAIAEAYEQVTGKELPDVETDSGREPAGTPWKEAGLPRIVPRLAARFG